VVTREISREIPPLYAAYERAPMVFWRDSWEDDGTGVWVRGGHPLDQHDHQDRGHVNYIHGGRPILIEAGTPNYSNPDLSVHYASGVGHNVLQVGTVFPERPYPMEGRAKHPGWQKVGCTAPITVKSLGDQGGHIVIDASGCYAETDLWQREVWWSQDGMTIVDEVQLKEGSEETVLFRWHLGAKESVEVSCDENRCTVEWPDAKIEFESKTPFLVTQQMAPDTTVEPVEDHQHTCLEVRTREKVGRFEVCTRVRARERK
jgi:hypothetical protein